MSYSNSDYSAHAHDDDQPSPTEVTLYADRLPKSPLFASDADAAIRRLTSLRANQVNDVDVTWAEDVIRGRRWAGQVHPWLVLGVAVMAKETRMPNHAVSRFGWLDGVYRNQYYRASASGTYR